MVEDVIDLISDDEDCCEETKPPPPQKTSNGVRTDSIHETNVNQATTRVKSENCAANHQHHQHQNGIPTFLGSQPSKGPIQDKPITRQFWKAGDYEVKSSSVCVLPNGMDHVRVHPKFLHSNATSHKWALGAIAELLDNSIDEVSNGATFVSVDKVTYGTDNMPALLVQDDGGGMDPDSMRHCMSLGYSRKTSNTTIGQYGNGFKTSTMRLGADVIVFSRCTHDRNTTQSIGLLSYTFLRATGHEDIVVPMVDFELINDKPGMLIRSTKEDWLKNLATLIQWSPYTTESELMHQFDDLGEHGTKLIVYNLWMNDDGELELDFDSDPQDIQVRGAAKLEKNDSLQKQLTNRHIANRLRYSLRAYASILYLKMPEKFQIILRGQVVDHLSIADDLKFPERILYKPQMGNTRDNAYKEVSVITAIGFAKEAPMVNVHGFNVYHKNRLIMPFWKVFQENSSRGRGVVGVLEANFMEPAHDKQDFEKTPILQRLETRLKQMTIEYWNLHCHLIGYQAPKLPNKPRAQSQSTTDNLGGHRGDASVTSQNQNESRQGETSAPSTPPQQPGTDVASTETDAVNHEHKPVVGLENKSSGSSGERKRPSESIEKAECLKRQKTTAAKQQSVAVDGKTPNMQDVLDEVERLKAKCDDYKAREYSLKLRIEQLEAELQEYKQKYKTLDGKIHESKKGSDKEFRIPKEEQK